MIYIDLDGVLADLEAYLVSKDPKAAEYEIDFFRLASSDKCFFLDSPVIEENLKLLRGEFRILSSLPCLAKFMRVSGDLDFSHNRIQKCYVRWADNKIQFCEKLGIPRHNVILVNSPKEKLRYCVPGDVLYDDRADTIEKWNALGGSGILVPYKSLRKECSD